MNQTCSRRHARWPLVILAIGLAIEVAWGQKPAAANPGQAPPAASVPASPMLETPEAPDKVVLKVGDQQFTKAQIDSLIASLTPQAQHALATQPQAKKQLGDQYAFIIMLSQQAQLHHLDQSPAFIRKMELQKQQLEAQSAMEEITEQAKPTPEEVQKYYADHAADYDQITARQAVVRVKPAEPNADPAHPSPATGPGIAPDEAKARAEAIRKELLAGADTKKITDEFKDPAGTVIVEPQAHEMRRGNMRPEIEKVAFALKDGAVSDPIELPNALVLVQVTAHRHVELAKATPEIEGKLRQQKIEASIAAVKKSNTLWMDEQYFSVPPKPTLGAPPTPPAGPSAPKP